MDDILDLILIVLERLYTEQYYLIKNRVSERSIVFWFGVYFYEILKSTEYAEYDLDVEYNRNHQGVKRTINYPSGTYPDLILHKRGRNDSNILIIEFKPWWNQKINDDLVKLKDFTKPDGEYNYKLGLSILIGRKSPIGVIIQNDKVVGGF